MLRTLPGKRILLTGASSGIGKALAAELAQADANLVLASRSAEKLEEVARSLRTQAGTIVTVPADIKFREDRERLVHTAVERLGGLDVLINNAGIASWGHFADSDESILREIMEVNFFAAAELIRLAIPHLADGNEAAIVNVASMCGRQGMPAWPEYSASKYALCGLSEALRGEMARFGIDVVLIVPGLTRTDLRAHMLRNEGRARIDFDSGMPAEYVARRIVAALRTGRRETVIGADAKWMLRMQRWLPRLLDWLLARKVRRLYRQEAARPQPVAAGEGRGS